MSVAAGGVLSGEHGIGLEKRDLMPLMFSAVDLAAQAALRAAFDPARPGQPGQGAARARPAAVTCRSPRRSPRARGSDGVRSRRSAPTAPSRSPASGRAGGPVAGVRSVGAPSGIDWIQPAEMTVSCGAGTMVAELDDALLAHGQCVAIPPSGTVGGALAVGRSGVRRLGYGPVRDVVLQARYVSAAGEIVKAGGPTVKNVSGFDVCRLLVGSRGTLGFLGDVILRTAAPGARTSSGSAARIDPDEVLARLYRPTSVLWDGTTTWVLLEGDERDVEAQVRPLGLRADGRAAARCRPVVAGRSPPSAISTLRGTFVAEVGRRASSTTSEPAPRRIPSRRSSRCTGGSSTASTPRAGSTPASTCSMAERRGDAAGALRRRSARPRRGDDDGGCRGGRGRGASIRRRSCAWG